MSKGLIILVLLVALIGLVGTGSAKTIDNTKTMQKAISTHNPNNVEMEVKTVKAGKSGNTVLVDPLHVLAD